MKKLKFKSLTMRIWTTFTAIILVIICSITLIYMFVFRRMSENAKIQDLKVAHEILLSNNFNQPTRLDELKNLRGSDSFLVNIDSNKAVHINDINKRIAVPPDQGKDAPPQMHGIDNGARTWMAGFIKEGSIYEKQFKAVYNNMNFIFFISSVNSNSSQNSYLISYMPDIQDNSLLYTMLIIGIVFIAIGFLTAKLVANYISKPLKELEKYTIKIAHKDWKEPIKLKNEDEIGRLAASMNRMQKELKHADEEEKMFLQSISHDLKTPVMVIMSHADAIIDGVYIDSVEKTAEIIRDEAISLEKKIKQLLYLNTLDYVLENNTENCEIELHDFILHIINRFELVNSKIEWDLDLDKISIKGYPEKLQVAIENILDNGLRYAKEKICITLKKENDFATLEIFNDGPNIKEEHLIHIFDNLYKDKTGNFGLGLTISKKIIEFYKGEIKAVNRENGVSFIIKYPIA